MEKKRSKAGAYAWRRFHRAAIPSILVFLAAVLGFPLLLFEMLSREGVSVWLTLFLFAAFLLSMRWVNKGIDVVDARWGVGARAEREVGRELEKLHKDGFHVFHDWLPENRGNVDHFVVGPQGVFAIETKGRSGEITCENGKLFKDGRPLVGKDPIKQVKGEAADVKRLISETRSFETWVNPIVCFNRADLRCYGTVDGVEITNPGSLRRIIAGGPVRYAPERVRSISYFLEKHLEVAPAARPGSPPEVPGRLKEIFRLDRVFVVAYAAYWLVLSIVFAGATAQLFEDLAKLFGAFEGLWAVLF